LLEARKDVGWLTEAVRGSDAVVNLAAQIPFGPRLLTTRAWRGHDLVRSEGTRLLVEAAQIAGVRRVVHQSASFVYADQGAEWVTEESPVCVTAATEPASVGELVVQGYASTCRTGVVLRMGLVVGDSALSRWSLRAAAEGRPVGVGDPEGFVHVIHSDDVGPAVLAALQAPSGIYNVGAEPVLRSEFAAGCAAAAGRRSAAFFGAVRTRVGGRRLEPLARSLRVSSARFRTTTGWAPRHDRFAVDWFDATRDRRVAVR
jgi:nucleoside-diphosphate-sugar epimerase